MNSGWTCHAFVKALSIYCESIHKIWNHTQRGAHLGILVNLISAMSVVQWKLRRNKKAPPRGTALSGIVTNTQGLLAYMRYE